MSSALIIAFTLSMTQRVDSPEGFSEVCDYWFVFVCESPAEHMTVNSACACVNSQFPVTHLASVVSNRK